jgi:hypothetical protein
MCASGQCGRPWVLTPYQSQTKDYKIGQRAQTTDHQLNIECLC